MSRLKNYDWKSSSFIRQFYNSLRGAIPLANEQLEVMVKLISSAGNSPSRFLDLGCGDGLLSAAILNCYPDSQGVLLDFSEHMLKSARRKMKKYVANLTFVNSDFSNPAWVRSVSNCAPFNVIVSGFSIHHQSDRRKKELYAEIYSLLKVGGLFLNLDQVALNSKLGESIWQDYFIDYIYEKNLKKHSGKSRDQVAKEFNASLEKRKSRLVPVELQCDWLRKIGFEEVDCYFKIFKSTIFGGRRTK